MNVNGISVRHQRARAPDIPPKRYGQFWNKLWLVLVGIVWSLPRMRIVAIKPAFSPVTSARG